MGRRRAESNRQQPPRPLPDLHHRTELGSDGYHYEVRSVAGARAVKTYRCPGCDQEIRPGIPHLVAVPLDFGDAGADDRRHWHTPCWTNRRSPTRKWS
ncbi:hypothetical protein KIH27_19535 [Mycobacterium sp. M1]|uniref:ATP/GTP-binding protein n=1 Tax=Mycolicibacter acidiphilus TaxID=2835306 RepID=A0ABS5RP25_9MYCO|nr:hypothetical protein [Mycolicibacter acidiphilus]MBS9535782.1 hypothetical protein [Mycolicibacter acidiphilus]